MLTRIEKQDLSDAGTILYGDLEALLMQNIIRHVKGYDQLIDSDTWLLQKLAEIGKLNQENIRIIARSARSNKAVLQKMLDETVDIVMDRIEPGFKELKKEGVIKKAPSPDQSENVKTAVKSIKKQAVSSMNLCSTTMLYKAKDACQKLLMNTFYQAQEIANKQEFLDTLGKHATAQVIGAESRQQAIRNTIREFNEKGIPGFVDKGVENGHRKHILL